MSIYEHIAIILGLLMLATVVVLIGSVAWVFIREEFF